MNVMLLGANMATEPFMRRSLEGTLTTGPTPEPDDAIMPGTTGARRAPNRAVTGRPGARFRVTGGTVRRAAAALTLATAIAAAVAAGTGAAEPPTCAGRSATAWLDAPGTHRGTAGDDVLVGSGGADAIFGGAGNDVICGDPFLGSQFGDDRLLGGAGNDVLRDFGGTNDLDGRAGNDDVAGVGTARGGAGDDVVFADGAGSVVRGGSGGDSLSGDIYPQAFDGGSGADECSLDPNDSHERCETIY